jgi:predicted nucleotidyltransferase
MRRDEALRIIAEHADELREKHAVKTLSIFGSTARDEARPGSDVDVLVEFSRPVGLFKFAGLQLYLEDVFGTSVDLAEPEGLHRRLRDRILSEAIRAA